MISFNASVGGHNLISMHEQKNVRANETDPMVYVHSPIQTMCPI